MEKARGILLEGIEDVNEIKDRDYRKYAKSILRTYENEYKELLENAED